MGLDELTGETIFSDDRPYWESTVAKEFIGNITGVGWIRATLKEVDPANSLILRETFLKDGSHAGDTIELSEVPKIKESAAAILSSGLELDPEIAEFLRKVVRLCDAAQLEENPIVF